MHVAHNDDGDDGEEEEPDGDELSQHDRWYSIYIYMCGYIQVSR